MKNICAAGATVPGYDVSHYQPNTHIHETMRMAGKKFCIIKSDEGNHTDSYFRAHWQAAKLQGMITGAYNFFHPSQDPVTQAKHMESIIGKLGPGDLGPVLDWETTDGLLAFKDKEAAHAFLLHVEQVSGKLPIIYTGPYFAQALALDTRFKRFPLWIAHHGARCPLVPPPWDTWTMWQYSDSNGKLDVNLFNGNIDQLRQLST